MEVGHRAEGCGWIPQQKSMEKACTHSFRLCAQLGCWNIFLKRQNITNMLNASGFELCAEKCAEGKCLDRVFYSFALNWTPLFDFISSLVYFYGIEDGLILWGRTSAMETYDFHPCIYLHAFPIVLELSCFFTEPLVNILITYQEWDQAMPQSGCVTINHTHNSRKWSTCEAGRHIQCDFRFVFLNKRQLLKYVSLVWVVFKVLSRQAMGCRPKVSNWQA